MEIIITAGYNNSEAACRLQMIMPTRDCTFMVAISPPNSQESLKYNVQQLQQNDATQIAIKPFCKNPLYYLILLGNGNPILLLHMYISIYVNVHIYNYV